MPFSPGMRCVRSPEEFCSDKFGARKVMAGGIVWWSVFTAMTGLAANLANMIWIRVAFGIGEGIFLPHHGKA